jgi:hypothetical protein
LLYSTLCRIVNFGKEVILLQFLLSLNLLFNVISPQSNCIEEHVHIYVTIGRCLKVTAQI